MKYLFCLFLFSAALAIEVSAQIEVPEPEAEDTSFMMPPPMLFRENLPIVNFEIDNAFLMRAFYPEYYADENKIRSDIRFVSRNDSDLVAMWDSLVEHYFVAYEQALISSSKRKTEPREFVRFVETPGLIVRKPHQTPVWKDIYVQSDVPDKLASLKELRQ